MLFDPHLTEEATEVQHGKLESHSKEGEELAFTIQAPRTHTLTLSAVFTPRYRISTLLRVCFV